LVTSGILSSGRTSHLLLLLDTIAKCSNNSPSHQLKICISIPVFPDQKIILHFFKMAPVATALKSETSDNASVGAIGRTTSGKPLKVRAYPKFDSLEEERLYRKQHLAAAYRIFAERGFDEGVAGHISVRDPILTDHFCTI
jgi:hypothetical protein